MAEVVVFGVVAADVVLRVQRIPAPGDHVNAEALGWRVGGSSANVACGLSTAGHHVRLVGPVGTDSMGDHLLAELEQRGVDTEYSFRANAASPRTLMLLDDTGERTIIAVDSGAGPSSFLPIRGPDLRSVDCVYTPEPGGAGTTKRPHLSPDGSPRTQDAQASDVRPATRRRRVCPARADGAPACQSHHMITVVPGNTAAYQKSSWPARRRGCHRRRLHCPGGNPAEPGIETNPNRKSARPCTTGLHLCTPKIIGVIEGPHRRRCHE